MESRNRRELIVEHPRTRHGADRGTVAGLLNIALLVACLAGAASAADPPPALTDAQREQLKERDRLVREANALQGQGKL
ncbi:MAG TPA: hypothetical protein VJY33_03295, partial [Isosphaeraceae bacterium]|nr:hypothetical protein [Isosphaeraceae bacterium]